MRKSTRPDEIVWATAVGFRVCSIVDVKNFLFCGFGFLDFFSPETCVCTYGISVSVRIFYFRYFDINVKVINFCLAVDRSP